MKKILLLFTMLIAGIGSMWGGVVTNRESAGTPMSFTQFKALAGTGKHFAIVGVSSNTAFCYPNWFGFTATFASSMTTDYLFDLEASATGDGWYNIKRVSDNKYISAEGGNFDTSTKLDFKLVNRTPSDYATAFSSTNFISLDNAGGNHYNCNTSNLGFRGGTGGYSVYAAYGPFYVVNVTCKKEDGTVIQSEKYIFKEGDDFVAPVIAWKELQTDISSYKNISADMDIELTYSDCYTPSFPDVTEYYTKVGSKVRTITASTTQTDNSHWYLLTQSRGGTVTPIYKKSDSNSINRAGSGQSKAKLDGVGDVAKYLVRFVAADNTGENYYIQSATGKFVNKPATLQNSEVLKWGDTPDVFKLYEIDGTTGYFGWNVPTGTDNSGYGMPVDNNGVGNSVVVWGSNGKVTKGDGSVGNNWWEIYPVAVNTLPFKASNNADTGKKYIMTLSQNERKYCGGATGADMESSYVIGNNNYIWSFEGNTISGFKIYNAGQEKYLKLSDSDNATASFVASGSATTFCIHENGSNHGIRLYGTDNNCLNYRDKKLSTWKNSSSLSDGGSKMTFTECYNIHFNGFKVPINGYEVSDLYVPSSGVSFSFSLPSTANYVYTYNDVEYSGTDDVATLTSLLSAITGNVTVDVEYNVYVDYTCKTMAGIELQANVHERLGQTKLSPPSFSGYTIDRVMEGEDEFDYANEDITSDKTFTIYYRLTTNPITESTIVSPTWYAVKQDEKYIAYNTTTEKVEYTSSFDFDKHNSYFWIFIGDETNGYYLYNKETSKYLVKGSEEVSGYSGDYYLDVSSTPSTKWIIRYVNGNNQLYDKTDDKFVNRVTVSSVPYPMTYTSSVGVSSFLTAVSIYDASYTFAKIESTKDFVGGFTSAKVDEAKTAVSNTQPTTVDAYETFVEALGSRIALEDGGYYRIRNAFTGFYGSQGVYKELYYSSAGAIKWKSSDNNDPVFLFKFTKHEDKWYIENLYAERYLISNDGGTVSTTPHDYSFVAHATNPGIYYINDGTQNMHAGGHNNGAGVSGSLIRYASGSASEWHIIPVEGVTNSPLIAPAQESVETVYQSYALDNKSVVVNNSDIQVYVVTSVSEGKAVMTEIENKVIKGGEGVILKGPRAKSLYFMEVSTDLDEDYNSNQLARGDGTAKTNNYVLAYKATDTEAHFYKIGTLVIPTNRAYLPSTAVTSDVKALSLSFDDDEVTTGVEADEMKQPEENAVVYDLQGRRVTRLQRGGLYIVGGKKVIVK